MKWNGNYGVLLLIKRLPHPPQTFGWQRVFYIEIFALLAYYAMGIEACDSCNAPPSWVGNVEGGAQRTIIKRVSSLPQNLSGQTRWVCNWSSVSLPKPWLCWVDVNRRGHTVNRGMCEYLLVLHAPKSHNPVPCQPLFSWHMALQWHHLRGDKDGNWDPEGEPA